MAEEVRTDERYVQCVVLKVCIKKIKIVLAKMEKVLYTILVSAVDIPR